MVGWRRNSGFSFLEILVALAILGAGFTVLLTAQASAVRKEARARHLMTATMLAREILTKIETEGVSDLPSGPQEFGEDFPGYAWEVAPLESANIPIDLAVGSSPVPSGISLTPDALKQVRIKVSWPEGGRQGSTELTFLVVPVLP